MLRDEAHFSSTVRRLREAALGAIPWETALADVTNACGATSANLVGVEQGQLQFIWANNLDPAMWTDLGEAVNDASLNPRLRVGARGRPFKRLDGIDFASDEWTRRYPVYGEVCRTYDLGLGALMNLEMSGASFVGLALLRGENQGHGRPGDNDALAALAPYVLDAIHLRRAIEDRGADLARDALASLGAAAFLCDAVGRVRRMTPRAERLVGRGGPFSLKGAVLTCRGDAPTQVLSAAISAAARRPDEPRRAFVLENGDTGRLMVEVSPLPPIESSLGFAPRVVVTVIERRGPPSAGLLASMLGLTLGEAQVARALALGSSRSRIAEDRGSSIETVRAQLKTIFLKVGVSREAELIARCYELS